MDINKMRSLHLHTHITHIHMYVWMDACMYACMYVYVYMVHECMHLDIYIGRY